MLQIFGKPSLQAKRILNIGFVTQDAEVGSKLKEFVADRDGIDLILIESTSVKPSSPLNGISVIVYDLDMSTDQSLREFERFLTQRPDQLPVVVLSPSVNDDLVRWFLRLKVADWIKTPLSPGELIASCGRVLSSGLSGKQDVKCLTFVGARGGVGATTLAIHAALILAARSAIVGDTCLIDLDLVAGSCADYLDLKPGWQIDELIPDPSRLDMHMLEIMIAMHASGIAVLAAQQKFCDPKSMNEDVITKSLDFASQKYPNIVIDLQRHAEAWTDNVLFGSNSVYIVTEFSIPGLKTARRMATDIVERSGSEVKPKVIVNKYKRTLFGNSISGHEVKEILKDYFAGYVHADSKLVGEAIDRGITTAEIKKNNSILRDLSAIMGTP